MVYMPDYFGVPEISENEATGELRDLFNDIQSVLKVPIVNFIFRTLGFYQEFLKVAWDEIRYNMLTVEVEEYAQLLRYPPLSISVPRIQWENINENAINFIKKIVFMFNYVNPKLLLIASAWAEALSNREIIGFSHSRTWISPGVLPGLPKLPVPDVREFQPEVQGLLLDIAKSHHAFDVASDFRMLALVAPEFLDES
jgi:hypothetical protein